MEPVYTIYASDGVQVVIRYSLEGDLVEYLESFVDAGFTCIIAVP